MKTVTKIMPDKPKKKKLRVVAYCRVSTSFDDQLSSLETQKSHYEEYIKSKRGWELAGIYFDEGITGTKKEVRPGLLQLIADCELGKIDYVITKSLSRFARNTTDCIEMVRKLMNLGIPIYFEKESINTGDMQDEFLMTLMGSLAEQESRSISDNQKWSYQERFKSGNYKAGYAPYGYTVTDGKYIVNEEEAVWVRYIFQQCLAGKGSYTIADDLNKRHAPTKKGGKWSESTVRAVLRNEKYIGDCLVQKTYMDDEFKRHVNHGERDQYYLQDDHQPIISRKTFEAAARMLDFLGKEKNVDSQGGAALNRYPFSGKIVCDHCGNHFQRRMQYTGSLVYPSWTCRQHLADITKCPQKSVKETTLQQTFILLMNKLSFGRKPILEMLRKALNRQTLQQDPEKMEAINKRLTECRIQQEQLADFLHKGYLPSHAYNTEMAKLKIEMDTLEKQRSVKRSPEQIARQENLDELITYLKEFPMQTTFDGEAFTRFVDHILVLSQTEFTFHLKCGLNLTERVKTDG